MSSNNTEDNIDQYCSTIVETTSSKKVSTSCEQNNVDNITKGIDSVAIRDDTSTCAACGKGGNSDDMNNCNKCKMVKYCNAACKKKHRSKHKKACERRVAELHEEALFKEVEPEECPICFLPLPIQGNRRTFQTCCGKSICDGCVYAMKMSEGGADLCAFCRTPNAKTDNKHIKRVKNLMDKGNAYAFNMLASCYAIGVHGMPQDRRKANELYLKGGELGCADAYLNLAIFYRDGTGVEVDEKKAKYYFELAAMVGSVQARKYLGSLEGEAGNYERSKKHFIIGARAGDEISLGRVKAAYMVGIVAKDEYAVTLHAYHKRQKEMKSDARDKASENFSLSFPPYEG